MQIINLTPHNVFIRLEDGETKIYERSGQTVRVNFRHDAGPEIDGAPSVTRRDLPEIEGLPSIYENPGALYIVSTMVFDAVPDRFDLIVPDSGPESAIRDDHGNIHACRRWIVRK